MSYRSHSSSHGLSDSSRLSLRERRRASRLARRGHGLVWCIMALLGALLTALPLRAGSDTPPQTQVKKAPKKNRGPTYNYAPYLLVFEPLGVRTKSLQGPRFRLPPLLPVRKEAHDTASAAPIRREASPVNEHKSESVLSADPLAPTISVPKTSGASNVSTAAEPSAVEPVDNALAPARGQEPELKDAAIYFEAPIGTHGARATIPIPASPSSPAQPQPPSSATYQQK